MSSVSRMKVWESIFETRYYLIRSALSLDCRGIIANIFLPRHFHHHRQLLFWSRCRLRRSTAAPAASPRAWILVSSPATLGVIAAPSDGKWAGFDKWKVTLKAEGRELDGLGGRSIG